MLASSDFLSLVLVSMFAMLMVVDEMMLCKVGENVTVISLVEFVDKQDFFMILKKIISRFL
jgi:hypothetical protein